MSSRSVTAPRTAPGTPSDQPNQLSARPRVLPSLRSRRQLLRLAAATVGAALLLGS